MLQVRERTVKLCESLELDDYLVQSADFVSPPKWHLAHTTWFFETFLLDKYVPQYRSIQPHFGYLFNSYYKLVGNHLERAMRGTVSRPTLEQVFKYRESVDEILANLLKNELPAKAKEILALGLAHEEQHQELLLMDIKHNLYQNPSKPAYRATLPSSGNSIPLHFESYHGGLLQMGDSGHEFHFDNESPRHQMFLNPFQLANRPATNREFLEFIEDGGYHTPALWLSDGWDQKIRNRWSAPLYWELIDGTWRIFTLEGMRELPLNEPVMHISYFEADAFAKWMGARLPTEAEWETAFTHEENAVNGRGEVWEWTGSPYIPYPGYRPPEGALGEYNGKFMCNQWVLRGGCAESPENHVRPTYRNFYAPEMRWQFAGLRLAKDAQ